MEIALCEDEQLFAEQLESGICKFFAEKGIEITVKRFRDGNRFTESLAENHGYGAVFMDINLGGSADGMELAARLREIDREVPVIFVTSLENRAADGYDVRAFGFVVKKNLSEKLPKVLEKLHRELFCKKSIAVMGKDFTEIIRTDRIICAQSRGRGTLVHTEECDYEDTRSIGHFAELLDAEDFIEVHKSVFVNISRIKRINADTVILCDDIAVPLSRRNRKSVMFSVMSKVRAK